MGISDEQTALGAELLEDTYNFLGRFVAYPSEDAHVAHTLWIVHTHLMDLWDSTPRLAFLSPEPGSGKTRAIEVTELLVPNAIEAVNVSPAYIFRKQQEGDKPGGVRPTILHDEIDTVFGSKAKDNEDIRGLYNAGHRRGAKTGRAIGGNNGKVTTEEIDAYGALALAGLGNLPDTILDRSIVVRMRPRASGEKVEPFRYRLHKVEGHELRERIGEWTQSLPTEIEYPELPAEIEDRKADKWESILAVAAMAGSEWLKRAEVAAVAAVADVRGRAASLGLQLLADFRDIIFPDLRGENRVTTQHALFVLNGISESGWGAFHIGKGITARDLSDMLSPYEIHPTNLKYPATNEVRERVLKGYRLEDFADAWERYDPPRAPGAAENDATDATPLPDDTKDNAQDAATGATDAAGEHSMMTREIEQWIADGKPDIYVGNDSSEASDTHVPWITGRERRRQRSGDGW